MDILLNDIEARVLGSLMEKSMTSPAAKIFYTVHTCTPHQDTCFPHALVLYANVIRFNNLVLVD